MRIISFITDEQVIKTILDHLGLWLIGSRPLAKAHAPHYNDTSRMISIVLSFNQLSSALMNEYRCTVVGARFGTCHIFFDHTPTVRDEICKKAYTTFSHS
jgi:hypothetical protein